MKKLFNNNFTSNQDTSISNNIDYSPINKIIYLPKSELKEVKQSDYDNGYIYRYFYRQANDRNSLIKEISESEYNKILNYFLYKVLKIKWKIIGDEDIAKNINKKISETANKTLVGINKLLERNLLLYWKDIPDVAIEFNVTNILPRTIIKKKI
jgi:hypothetical protein